MLRRIKRFQYPPYTEPTLCALGRTNNNKVEAAKILGISLSTLYTRLRRITKIASELKDKRMLNRLSRLRRRNKGGVPARASVRTKKPSSAAVMAIGEAA